MSDRTLVEREQQRRLMVERDSLIASIDDLEREHDAGDLSESDYAQLLDRDTALLAKVLRALEEDAFSAETVEHHEISLTAPLSSDEFPDAAPDGRETPDVPARRTSGLLARTKGLTRPRVSGAWRLLITVILLAVVAASVVLVVKGTSQRLPDETATGSVKLDPQQRIERSLAQAETFEAQGDASEALQLYHQVLLQDPDQVQALAESGWLEYEAGVLGRNSSLLAEGQTEEQRAERVDPTDYAPHLYLGSMLLVEGDDSGAIAQYRSFLQDDPPASTVKSAAPFIQRAFRAEGLTPPALGAG